MFNQAGIYEVKLYERKGFAFEWPDTNTVNNITSTGQTIDITHYQRPVLEMTPKVSFNKRVVYEYSLTFIKENFNLASLSYLKQLRETIYGWVPVITMYDQRQLMIDVALFFDEANNNSTESNSVEITIITRTDTRRRLLEVIEDSLGNKLLINDTDYLLINDTDHLLIS